MVTFQQFDSGKCSFTAFPICALGWTWMKRLFGDFVLRTVAVSARKNTLNNMERLRKASKNLDH